MSIRTASWRVTLCAGFVAALVALQGLADRAAGKEIRLTTAYQTVPVELTINGERRQLRKIYLSINLCERTGVLTLDATTCKKVDAWGEVADCAPGLYQPEKVTLAQVKTPDPAGRERRLFGIFDASPEERLFVVVPTYTCDSYRLTVRNKKDEVTRILTMELECGPCDKPANAVPCRPACGRKCGIRRIRRCCAWRR